MFRTIIAILISPPFFLMFLTLPTSELDENAFQIY